MDHLGDEDAIFFMGKRTGLMTGGTPKTEAVMRRKIAVQLAAKERAQKGLKKDINVKTQRATYTMDPRMRVPSMREAQARTVRRRANENMLLKHGTEGYSRIERSTPLPPKYGIGRAEAGKQRTLWMDPPLTSEGMHEMGALYHRKTMPGHGNTEGMDGMFGTSEKIMATPEPTRLRGTQNQEVANTYQDGRALHLRGVRPEGRDVSLLFMKQRMSATPDVAGGDSTSVTNKAGSMEGMIAPSMPKGAAFSYPGFDGVMLSRGPFQEVIPDHVAGHSHDLYFYRAPHDIRLEGKRGELLQYSYGKERALDIYRGLHDPELKSQAGAGAIRDLLSG